MSKGKGRLFISGENTTDGIGQHNFVVRVPDGYRPTYCGMAPVEGQPAGDTKPLGWVYTTDNLPAVVDGGYYNAVAFSYENVDTGTRGVFYQVFFEPVDGSDLGNPTTV